MKEHIFHDRGVSYRTNAFIQERQTLVFIHGLSGSSSAWGEYEEHFQQTYNILTLDLRGHGLSRKYESYDDYDISLFVQDLHALIASLNIKACILISHSYGSIIALEYMKAYEVNVGKAIFLAPAFDVGKTTWAHRFAVNTTCTTNLMSLLPSPKSIVKRIDYTKFGYTADYDLRRICADIACTSLKIYLFCLRHIFLYDVGDSLRNIKVPTLLIQGKNDRIVPAQNAIADAKEMNKDTQKATLVLLEKANHILVLNNAEQVIKEIKAFVG